jgi:hypothetical protein
MEQLSLRQAFKWPLIFALSLGVLHFAVSVPKSEMIERKSSKKKKKKKKKKKGKYPEYESFDREHRDEGFALIHEPVMHFAYGVAHSAVFADARDAPESYLSNVECHRWACMYEMCGPRHEITQITRLLKTLEHEDEDLFDEWESKSSKSEDKKTDICHRIVARFSRPSPEVKGIRVQKEALDKVRKTQAARARAKKKKVKRPKRGANEAPILAPTRAEAKEKAPKKAPVPE